ncbi:periplasmic component of amino acid ABC-type transporter/signal transduction system [Xenococcus sp. PCC 7305]|uniref:amino acid ABC transporter substrate-binding protein n=1 Tax=Xenococcus sp. PCC 7305 TaxID=102125 RepID=UPI0002ABA548|nr:transporter substrate-binding domain-containing protein [Xenococcus sp. PCC 7305]ELS03378.1 periplasmic component of amino acid ABC-type transporter/signal transduction system [Xenococcus sp. PCC 7305]
MPYDLESRHITHYPLPITHYPLPITYYLFLTVKLKRELFRNFRAIKFCSATIIFICIIVPIEFRNNAVAQSTLPKDIRMGIQELASSIGKRRPSGNWGGFCPLFGQELAKELQASNTNMIVKAPYITNSYANRYDGLKQNLVQIECGPNTIISDQKILEEKGWTHIEFSDPFHTTGIKILLKKELAKSSEDEIGNIPQDKLKDIVIGVIYDTTTYYQLKKSGYKFVTFKTIEAILQALEKGEQIQAYADDALILKTLLESDYQNEGYVLYPQKKGDYLPRTAQEDYGLVVLKDSGYSQLLLDKINKTLEIASIKAYQEKLKNEETGQTKQQLLEEQDRYITEILQKFKEKEDANRILILVIAVLSILSIVLTFLLILQSSRNRDS